MQLWNNTYKCTIFIYKIIKKFPLAEFTINNIINKLTSVILFYATYK